MRHKVAHALLALFVVTLVTSNLLLANKLIDARTQLPALIGQLAVAQPQATPGHPQVVLNTLTPDYGPVGTRVTITGSGFSTTGNIILFDYHEIFAGSYNGTTLSFIVPEYLHLPCPSNGQACPTNDWQAVMPRPYTVRIKKQGAGQTNALTFVVTPSTINNSKVKIRSLKPTAGPTGTVVTITGSGFTTTGNTVNFAYHQITGIRSNGTTLKFTVPKELIYPCVTNMPCPTSAARAVTPGEYRFSVTNSRGTSNMAAFTVKPPPTPKPTPSPKPTASPKFTATPRPSPTPTPSRI